jgi:predicted nucleotidyltransferase
MMRTETGGTEESQQVLANLLFGTYRHRVLSLLLLRPGDRFHVRMISRLTGVPAGSLHRELRQLAEAGLLSTERSGNQVLYSANQSSSIFRELSAILDKTAGAPPMLDDHSEEHSVEVPNGKLEWSQQSLAKICRKYGVKKLSLFGSAARGELRPDSDVDLMVEFKRTSKTSLWDLTAMQEELSAVFGNRKVQTASPAILDNPYRRKTIEPDLTVLYAARSGRR